MKWRTNYTIKWLIFGDSLTICCTIVKLWLDERDGEAINGRNTRSKTCSYGDRSSFEMHILDIFAIWTGHCFSARYWFCLFAVQTNYIYDNHDICAENKKKKKIPPSVVHITMHRWQNGKNALNTNETEKATHKIQQQQQTHKQIS